MKLNKSIVAIATLLIIATLGQITGANPPSKPRHNLSKAKVVDQVILAVIEDYYDPTRIDSGGMFKAAMDSLQKFVAEVRVDFKEDGKSAAIDILGKKIQIDLGELNSPWRLSKTLRRVFLFLETHLPEKEYDFSDLEYSMANGMLTVLDPHSNVLPPEIYENLRMDTAGKFSGLGIRITTDRRPPCSGYLTVVGVFEKAPAAKSGIRIGDRITRIDGESTVNITTSEAAKRLRGRAGSYVKLEVRRPNGKTEKLSVRRETVPIESVKSKLLGGGVGYVSLDQFQGNSAREVENALRKLTSKGMNGLILDLRGNPGGLLDIAIQIADFFLESGTIVATAGRRGKHNQSVRNASPSGTQPDYPLVVLIDGGSASAAEIIAGALGNHGRALLIGKTTFGKGSVQMVQPLAAGGALKLTSAQYLTPGDISIQAVGVPPNITFVSITVDKEDTDWGKERLAFSEADLAHHLDRPTARRISNRENIVKAAVFVPASERRTDRARFERCYVDDEERLSFKDRYEVEFARRLLASFDGKTADEMLLHAKKQIQKDEVGHNDSIHRTLRKMGVKWSGSKGALRADKEASKESPKVRARANVQGRVFPGKSFKINVSVTNSSRETIRRLRASANSDNFYLNDIDFVFGDLKPGKRQRFSQVIELPYSASARTDSVKIQFVSEGGLVPAPVEVNVDIPPVPLPHLAYSWQFEDLDNYNGVLEPGEEVRMHVTVKNLGPGNTVDAQANLSGKPGVDIVLGRFNLGRMRPGDTVTNMFSLRISDGYNQVEAPLTLVVSDYIPAKIVTSRTLLTREIEMPVLPPTPGTDVASGTVTANRSNADVFIFESPSRDARKVGIVRSGATFQLKRVKREFFGVVLSKNRTGWIKRSDTSPGGRGKPAFSPILFEPPVIALEGNRVRKTSKEKVQIRGNVTHPSRVRDLMVFVGDRKLIYQPNQSPSSAKQMSFSTEVPLEEGSNFVTIIARHDDKTVSTLPVFVRREGKTP